MLYITRHPIPQRRRQPRKVLTITSSCHYLLHPSLDTHPAHVTIPTLVHSIHPSLPPTPPPNRHSLMPPNHTPPPPNLPLTTRPPKPRRETLILHQRPGVAAHVRVEIAPDGVRGVDFAGACGVERGGLVLCGGGEGGGWIWTWEGRLTGMVDAGCFCLSSGAGTGAGAGVFETAVAALGCCFALWRRGGLQGLSLLGLDGE